MEDEIYKEFRSDGFPLCPLCGEDELCSILMLNWNGDEATRPTIGEILASGMSCYYCKFVSPRTGENL